MIIVLFWLMNTYWLEHLWLNSVFLHFPCCWKQTSGATSASKQNHDKQDSRGCKNLNVSEYNNNKTNCNSLVFYLVPKVSCSAPAVKDTVHCSSIRFHGCRTGHSGCRRQSDRRQRSRCSILPGHNLLSLVGRRCLSVSAAERKETQMVMY